MGQSSTESVSDDESISCSKKCDHTEERSAQVKELKVKLQQNHGSNYSTVQYTLWTEMLVGETHDSLDNPSEVPMFELKRVHGKSSTCSSDLNAALTGMAIKAL